MRASYHWLDRLDNPIVWDGTRTRLPHDVAPGETLELELAVTAPRPPGSYRLAFDLVEEHRFWFAEVGAVPLAVDVEVAPRIGTRALEVLVHGGSDPTTTAALGAQEEPVVERTAQPSRTCSPEPCRRRSGRACCSTPTRRVGRRSGQRSSRRTEQVVATMRSTRGARGAAIPASTSPCSSVAAPRVRGVDPPRPAGLHRRRGPVRRPRRGHTSAAIRSSTALKIQAPRTSATAVSTTR